MLHGRKVLKNGLRVITIPMPSLESATAMVMVGAGSRYETRKNNGISHFLEHMAFKGTEKRPTAMDISTLIDSIGGEFNAFTSKEITGYYVKAAAGQLELLLDILSDMLTNSKLEEAEIEKEKGVIIEEMNLYEDNPARKIGDVYERLIFGNTPMGWDIIGEKDVIRSLKRSDFVSYMQSLYSPSNMTLVVAGGVSEEKVLELAEKYFSPMSKFDTESYKRVEKKQKKPAVLVKSKATEQVHMAMGFLTVPIDHPDKFPLSVLSAILGGGMSSRLFDEIREKRGLAYYVRSTSDHYQDAGTIASSAGLDPRRIDEAIKVMLEEHFKIKEGTKPIKPQELSKAKEFIKGHFILELEDSRSVASFYAQEELLEKDLKDSSEILQLIDRVSLEDVERVVQKYIDKSTLNLAVIGNFEDEERFKKLLTS